MNKFRHALEQSALLGDSNSCGVIALSVITGKPYADCYKTLQSLGRRHADGTRVEWLGKALEAYGYSIKPVYSINCLAPEAFTEYLDSHHILHIEHQTQRYLRRKKLLPGMTTKTIARNAPRKYTGDYLVMTAYHVAAIKGGVFEDHSADRLLRVQSIVEVIRS